MRLRPYHWWYWLIWILGEGSDRQDRVEIKNGQNDRQGYVSPLFLCFWHAIWMTEGIINVQSNKRTTQSNHARGHTGTNMQHLRVSCDKYDVRQELSMSLVILKYGTGGIDVCVHTLGLGDHFGPTPPPAVHHWGAGTPPRVARTLSPGTNTTWTTKTRMGRSRESALIHRLQQCVWTGVVWRQTDEDLDEGGWQTPPKHSRGETYQRRNLTSNTSLCILACEDNQRTSTSKATPWYCHIHKLLKTHRYGKTYEEGFNVDLHKIKQIKFVNTCGNVCYVIICTHFNQFIRDTRLKRAGQ